MTFGSPPETFAVNVTGWPMVPVSGQLTVTVGHGMTWQTDLERAHVDGAIAERAIGDGGRARHPGLRRDRVERGAIERQHAIRRCVPRGGQRDVSADQVFGIEAEPEPFSRSIRFDRRHRRHRDDQCQRDLLGLMRRQGFNRWIDENRFQFAEVFDL